MPFRRSLTLFATLFGLFTVMYASSIEKRNDRTIPPVGAAIVRGSGTEVGEFATIQAAVTSLPADGSAQVIFVYPGIFPNRNVVV